MKSFVVKINKEFTKSLPSNSASLRHDSDNQDDEDPEIDQLLLEAKQYNQQDASSDSGNQETIQEPTIEEKSSTNSCKSTPEKPAEKFQVAVRKLERPKPPIMKIEKVIEVKEPEESEKDVKEYLDVDSSAMYTEDEDQIDDDGNLFVGEEMYDIMEIENEGDNIYIDESGKQVLGGDDEGEFILVNFKSSTEDLAEKDQQFVVEELYDDDASETKSVPSRKKHVNRMPREIIEKYAQSTVNNQHICTKCVKVFSTRTNLIRHIQSHDGYKAYVCQICSKGFTQSGSLKQHMYIHTGQRPYKCQYCDRAFTQGKTLKFHLRRHTEEKPFICTECNAAFRQRDGLKRHLKSRHNIELKFDRNNQLTDKVVGFVNVDPNESGVAEIEQEIKKD